MSDDLLFNPYAAIAHVIPERFYVGGWSAAVFHNLTGDIPLDVFVMAETKQSGIYHHDGVTIRCFAVPDKAFFGIAEKEAGILVSDIHKTALDALLYPNAFGGSLSAGEVWNNYCTHPDKDFKQLLSYADRIGNRRIVDLITKELSV